MSIFSLFLTNGAHADTNLSISGNGYKSYNVIDITTVKTTTVEQNNTAQISNNVEVNTNTGNVSANGNTGSNTTISTGDAATQVGIENDVNKNVLALDCSCKDENLSAKISNNGALSDNIIRVNQEQKTEIAQNNEMDVDNHIVVNSNTGALNNSQTNPNPSHNYDQNHDKYKNHHDSSYADHKKDYSKWMDKYFKKYKQYYPSNWNYPTYGKTTISTGDVYSSIEVSNKGNVNMLML